HQIDRGGEQQFPRVAPFRRVFKQRVQGRRRQGVLNRCPRHHTDGTLVDKLVEHRPEDHGRLPALGSQVFIRGYITARLGHREWPGPSLPSFQHQTALSWTGHALSFGRPCEYSDSTWVM